MKDMYVEDNENSNKETNLSNDHNGNNTINSSKYKSLINDNSATLTCIKIHTVFEFAQSIGARISD